MIRSDELLSFLETISHTVSHELRPDLQSGHAKKSADYLIQVLDRLVAQVRDGERIATTQLDIWRQLQDQLPFASAARPVAPSSTPRDNRERLELELDVMQRRLLEDQCFAELTAGLQYPGSPQSNWFRKAAAATFDLWESIEDSVQPPVPKKFDTGSSEELERLRAALSAYLKKRFPQLPKDCVTALRIAAGGTAKLTALFSLSPNAELPHRLVLRQDVATSITSTSVPDEFPIVERLFKLGLRVPEPILVETDPNALGGAFMIMSEIADSVPAGTYFAKDRAQQPRMIGPQFAREAAEELARLHRLTAIDVPNAAALASVRRDGVDKAHRRWRSINKPPYSVIVDLGFAWLKCHPLTVDRPRCLIHGDYGVHNMMARDDHLAGVLDWEFAQEDDPAIDLAEWRMLMVEDTHPWEQFVADYIAAGGDPRACDPDAITYYCVWMFTVKFGLMVSEARNYFVSGARTDSLMASEASHAADRILQYLARALRMATE
jgi:aminoglycoside phosphotransferase (APT) family kinase protein